jgi:hypothetical protein
MPIVLAADHEGAGYVEPRELPEASGGRRTGRPTRLIRQNRTVDEAHDPPRGRLFDPVLQSIAVTRSDVLVSHGANGQQLLVRRVGVEQVGRDLEQVHGRPNPIGLFD